MGELAGRRHGHVRLLRRRAPDGRSAAAAFFAVLAPPGAGAAEADRLMQIASRSASCPVGRHRETRAVIGIPRDRTRKLTIP